MSEAACPSCAKTVRLPEGMASLLTQCKGCGMTFLASAPRPPRAASSAGGERRLTSPPAPRDQADEDLRRRITRPGADVRRCPVCDESIARDAERCKYCGEELVGNDQPRERLDCEPHRGPLIVFLGTISLIGGLVAFCSFGLSGLLSLPTGITAWLLAERDLRKMEANDMDRAGMAATGTGRQNAIAGVVLSALFAMLYGLLFFWAS